MNYIETGSLDPCYNLAFEEYILTHKLDGEWLMLWQNANTVVVGLNQNAAQEINAGFVKEHGISVVRRSTGGGTVYHDLGNLNYSFITDVGERENLSIEKFSAPVCKALAAMGLNASVGGRNDIIIDGKKVSGVAQRISGKRILHHGTLLFRSDSAMIAGALNPDPDKFASKSSKSVRSRVGNIYDFLPEKMELEAFKEILKQQLLNDGALRQELEAEELAQIEQLADSKYRSYDWTYGRSPQYSFHNSQRFPEGKLEVFLNVEKGLITDIHFSGDFMAVVDCDPISAALIGKKITSEAVAAVLDEFDTDAAFGGISRQQIQSLILNI